MRRHKFIVSYYNETEAPVGVLKTELGWKPESSYPPESGVEPLNCMVEHALESVR